jgi:hypothetical protein
LSLRVSSASGQTIGLPGLQRGTSSFLRTSGFMTAHPGPIVSRTDHVPQVPTVYVLPAPCKEDPCYFGFEPYI